MAKFSKDFDSKISALRFGSSGSNAVLELWMNPKYE